MMVFILKNATDYYIHKSLHNHMLVSQFCYKNRNKNSIAHLQFIESHIPWIKKKLKAGRISHCTINRNPNKTVICASTKKYWYCIIVSYILNE